MDDRIDEKGKVFTKYVTKRSTPVLAQVGNAIIQGIIHLTLDNRLKDELNTGESFIAITDAQVRESGTDRLLCRAETVIVNKTQIAWVSPRDDARAESSSDSPAE